MSALRRVSLWVAAGLTLSAGGHHLEQRAATGAIAGAVVAGPVGAAVEGGAGAVIDKVSE